MTEERKAQEKLLSAWIALEYERQARRATERLAAETMDKLVAMVGEQARARCATESLAIETVGNLAVLLGKQTLALAIESKRRRAAEARAALAEQARDELAAEIAGARRMIAAHRKKIEENDKAPDTGIGVDGIRRQVAAELERLASADPMTQSAGPPRPKRAKRLPKKPTYPR